jgi:hypothetical protein
MASILKHLRSSTANKRPTASGLADGQIAINTASGTPAMFFKDSAGNVVKVGPAHVGTSAPNASPAGSAGNSTGELWVDNSLTTPGLNYYTGSAFVNLTPSGTTSTVGLVELATNAETQAGSDAVRAITSAGLQSKLSDSTSTTSSTTIASSTAVKSAYDLANAALPKSGGTLTGELLISPSGSLVFEGSSDDSFETTIAVTNPTADRTITFPNVTGTVITTGDTGSVTSTMIANDTIVDADINASAAIAPSKLGSGALPSGVTVASANIVDGTIVNADVNASAAIAGTKISPDFGGQNVVTTGNVTGAALIPSSSTVPTNGVYLPSANTVAFSTNSTGQVFINSNGNLGVGTLSATNTAGKIHARADGDEPKSLLVLQNRNTGGSAAVQLTFINGGIDYADDRYSYIRSIVTGAGQNGNNLTFATNPNGGAAQERLRIDSSGRLLVGTSTAATTFFGGTITPQIQLEGTSNNTSTLSLTRRENGNATASLSFGKTRGGTTVVQANDGLGFISFEGSDGTNLIRGASITAAVDGTPGANDMPGRIVLSTTADGASSPTERFRITNDGVIAHDQPAPAAVNATATLTVANLKTGIITSTSAAATDMTLPTGTDTQAGFSGTYDNFTFEWSVINTGPSLVRVLAGTAHTIVGSGSVATGTSGRFASRRTAANTFVTYRLS